MKVLVTGGAGYIGAVTSDVLLRAGHGVIVLDNLSTGHRGAVPSGAEFIHGDLADLHAVREAMARTRPEAVIHFAGHADVGESMRHPFKYLRENVLNGLHLLQAAVERGVKRFILSSSANLFSDGHPIPIGESASAVPASPYGESKLYLEHVLSWLERTHGLSSVSLRYFNAAGATEERGEAHDPETHLIPVVLLAALERVDRVSILGEDYDTPDGTCIRDFVHVSDLAQAHLLALEARDRGSRSYNLGNGKGFSVREVIETARRITQRPIRTVVAPRRPGDPARLVADSTKIRTELGWKPAVPELGRIIESAWLWLQRHPDGYEG